LISEERNPTKFKFYDQCVIYVLYFIFSSDLARKNMTYAGKLCCGESSAQLEHICMVGNLPSNCIRSQGVTIVDTFRSLSPTSSITIFSLLTHFLSMYTLYLVVNAWLERREVCLKSINIIVLSNKLKRQLNDQKYIYSTSA